MNNKYFKMLVVLGLVVVMGISGGAGVLAQETIGGPNSEGSSVGGGTTNGKVFTITNPLKVDSIGGLVQTLVEVFSYIAILFAVVVFIYIGFQYVVKSAQGNTAEISKLHNSLFWLVVGVAVVISARVIVQLVINTLSATGTIDKGVIDSAYKASQGSGTK
jgi:hypothetical protein